MTKVALVHDYLNQRGGAERVFKILCELFPDAPIYTLVYDKEKFGAELAGRQIKTSWLDHPFVARHHHWFIPVTPFAAQTLRVEDGVDLVISDSAGYAKGVAVPPEIKHLAYCYSPLRYAWEADLIYGRLASAGVPLPLATLATAAAYPVQRYLRSWDRRAAQQPERIVAISKFIAKKIKTHYGREASVLYPPVDTTAFAYNATTKKENYYLAVGRLLHYKRFDLVVDAFNALGAPLKIVGSDGRYEAELRRRAKPNIEFCGQVSDAELVRLYQAARGFIFPQVEDFGLVAVEAIACGTPVVAYAAGGAKEIVEDGKNGVLFYEQTAQDIIGAVHEAESMSWDYAAIAASAARFGVERFKKEFGAIVEAMV